MPNQRLINFILNNKCSKLFIQINHSGIFQLKKLQEVAKTEESADKKEVNLTLLPPEHPQLLRRVGSDGLLVSWTPPEDDEVTGFLVNSP